MFRFNFDSIATLRVMKKEATCDGLQVSSVFPVLQQM